jgi:hypothetical protein
MECKQSQVTPLKLSLRQEEDVEACLLPGEVIDPSRHVSLNATSYSRNCDVIKGAETENPHAYYYNIFWSALPPSSMTILKWMKIQYFVIRGIVGEGERDTAATGRRFAGVAKMG